ncbi:MAG: HEAT repeat domain-containing protein, partial [Proteobacteria bacterium]|nr:HEAT repeat domain-containing protein [Pseudomonadota bacterium]
KAADALGRIGSEKAIEPLISALSSKRNHVRGSAADALGRMGSEKAIEPFISALFTDNDAHVRWRATCTLGSIGDTRAVEPLKKALDDEGKFYGKKIKNRAFRSLEQISRRIHKRIPLEPQ